MTLDEVKAHAREGGRFRVYHYPGIAFYYAREEDEADEDSVWTGLNTLTGMAIMVMVGDDEEHSIDPEDVEPLNPGDYCRTCGQIGCQHDIEEE